LMVLSTLTAPFESSSSPVVTTLVGVVSFGVHAVLVGFMVSEQVNLSCVRLHPRKHGALRDLREPFLVDS
jgi:hypothetical protein